MAKKKVAKKKVAKKKVAKKKVAKKKVARPVDQVLQPLVLTTPALTKKKMRKTKTPIGTCFVLIPFKEPFETYYRLIIKPAIGSANLEVKRGDSLFTPTPIMGDVWQMVQEAKVLVAELTEKNANVFYELGLAHAIGKSVVLISETMDDVPFDLQQLRVILYDKDDPAWGNKLKTSLTNALQETVGSPVDAVPPMFRKKVKSQAPEDSEISLRMLELERRMRSLASDRPLGMREHKGDVVWEGVEKYLTRFPRSTKLTDFKFSNREEAVAWTITKIRAGMSARNIRKELVHQINEHEANIVFDFALKHA